MKKMMPRTIQQQFQNYGNFKTSDEKSRMVSLTAEQACAIIYPYTRSYNIVAHIATFEGPQIHKDSHGMTRLVPQYIKQQLID